MLTNTLIYKKKTILSFFYNQKINEIEKKPTLVYLKQFDSNEETFDQFLENKNNYKYETIFFKDLPIKNQYKYTNLVKSQITVNVILFKVQKLKIIFFKKIILKNCFSKQSKTTVNLIKNHINMLSLINLKKKNFFFESKKTQINNLFFNNTIPYVVTTKNVESLSKENFFLKINTLNFFSKKLFKKKLTYNEKIFSITNNYENVNQITFKKNFNVQINFFFTTKIVFNQKIISTNSLSIKLKKTFFKNIKLKIVKKTKFFLNLKTNLKKQNLFLTNSNIFLKKSLNTNIYINNLSLIKQFNLFKINHRQSYNYFFKSIKYNNFVPVYDFYSKQLKTKQKKMFVKKIPDFSVFYIYYLQNFLETFLKQKTWIKINTNSNNISIEASFLLTNIFKKYKYEQNAIGQHFYMNEFLEIIYLTFLNRDLIFFLNWFKKIMEKIHLKKHKKMLKIIHNILKNNINVLYALNVKGFNMDVRGKLGTTGNSKKKHYAFTVGSLGFTKKDHNLIMNQTTIRTTTGVLGVTAFLSL